MHAPVRVEYNRPIDSVLLKVVFVFGQGIYSNEKGEIKSIDQRRKQYSQVKKQMQTARETTIP
jgi:hypothetical protein